MNNYADRGGYYSASVDKTLRYLHNSSYPAKVELINVKFSAIVHV